MLVVLLVFNVMLVGLAICVLFVMFAVIIHLVLSVAFVALFVLCLAYAVVVFGAFVVGRFTSLYTRLFLYRIKNRP